MKKVTMLLAALFFTTAFAAPTATLAVVEHDFDANEQVHLIKQNKRLFAINDPATIGEKIRIFRRKKNAAEWVDITDNKRMYPLNRLTDINSIVQHGGATFIAGKKETGEGVIMKRLNTNPLPGISKEWWSQVGGNNLGLSADIEITSLVSIGNRIFAFVDTGDSMLIYRSKKKGNKWKQVGEMPQLENNDHVFVNATYVTNGSMKYLMVVAEAKIGPNFGDVNDSEGFIYRAPLNDLSNWQLTKSVFDLPGTQFGENDGSIPKFYAVARNAFAVADFSFSPGHDVEVYETHDGVTFQLLGTAGLTSQADEKGVSYLRRQKGKLYAGGYTDQASIYEYDYATSAWTVADSLDQPTGFDTSSTRTAGEYPLTSPFMKYKGLYYQGVYNFANNTGRIEQLAF